MLGVRREGIRRRTEAAAGGVSNPPSGFLTAFEHTMNLPAHQLSITVLTTRTRRWRAGPRARTPAPVTRRLWHRGAGRRVCGDAAAGVPPVRAGRRFRAGSGLHHRRSTCTSRNTPAHPGWHRSSSRPCSPQPPRRMRRTVSTSGSAATARCRTRCRSRPAGASRARSTRGPAPSPRTVLHRPRRGAAGPHPPGAARPQRRHHGLAVPDGHERRPDRAVALLPAVGHRQRRDPGRQRDRPRGPTRWPSSSATWMRVSARASQAAKPAVEKVPSTSRASVGRMPVVA